MNCSTATSPNTVAIPVPCDPSSPARAACVAVMTWCRSGAWGGGNVQGLTQVAVGGGVADVRVRGEGVQVGAVAQPAQHEEHLGEYRACPLPGPRLGTVPMPGQPAGHRLQDGRRHVVAGTMGHGDELPAKRSQVYGETSLVPGARPRIPPAATSGDASGRAVAGCSRRAFLSRPKRLVPGVRRRTIPPSSEWPASQSLGVRTEKRT